MLKFKYKYDKKTHSKYIETNLWGKPLLTSPQLNKGTAFTEAERKKFKLSGKLPTRVETLEEQVKRALKQYNAYTTNLKRNIYLSNLHDNNQVLFYKLVSEHLVEMMPTIYTPIVGTAVKEFSHEFRQSRGIYLTYSEQDHLEELLGNRTNPDIDIIVVTDGEGVLGIGDQGIGGMDIPVAKLMVYTLCGGINPCRTLPICLDVGTNNQALLQDPLYLGWRHERIRGKAYDKFIGKFVAAVQKKFPKAFLHWEDFGRDNAHRNLKRFQDKLCTFNDDIQGTGAVTLAALLAGVNATHSKLTDQRIVVFGAGTAGTGITDQICQAMQAQGLSAKEARKRFWLIDRQGLLTDDLKDLTPAQKPYARSRAEVAKWKTKGTIDLAQTVKQVQPTVLIGCSARSGAFTKAIIQTMASAVPQPIILPLSNPTERSEATPQDLLDWTDGKALIATGSPFDAATFAGQSVPTAQCNNALVFPGIGLAVIAIKAKRLSPTMIWQACHALSECAPIRHAPLAPLLPSIAEARDVAKKIAVAVAAQGIKEGLATINKKANLEKLIDELFWQAEYLPYRRLKNKQ